MSICFLLHFQTPPLPAPPPVPSTVTKNNPYAHLVSRIQYQTALLAPPQPVYQSVPHSHGHGHGQMSSLLHASLLAPPPPPPPPEEEQAPKPPPDLEPVIEKTAMYVAKNGSGFEATILSRGTPLAPGFLFYFNILILHNYFYLRILMSCKKLKYLSSMFFSLSLP